MRQAILLIIMMMVLPSRADAYLDPGASSILMQSLFAGIVGSYLAIKTYFSTARFFRKNAPAEDKKAEK